MAHTLNNDIAYLLADNLGIGMRFARRLMIAKVKNMAPFGKGICICHNSIGVNRQHTSCILWLQA